MKHHSATLAWCSILCGLPACIHAGLKARRFRQEPEGMMGPAPPSSGCAPECETFAWDMGWETICTSAAMGPACAACEACQPAPATDTAPAAVPAAPPAVAPAATPPTATLPPTATVATTVATLAPTTTTTTSTACSSTIDLYRYWGHNDHFYTGNWAELGGGAGGYKYEGVQCQLVNSVCGGVPLYRYYKHSVVDHFYTTNAGEIGTTTAGQTGNHGYKSEGIAGYCYPTQEPGTVPLYRYWKSSISDHFYTTNSAEIGTTTSGQIGNYDYKSEGIQCYVFPAPR